MQGAKIMKCRRILLESGGKGFFLPLVIATVVAAPSK